MGAATYIGRVGGLAVALGVGTAIVTGQGVAFADDGATGAANSSPSDAGSSGPANPGSVTSPDTSASTKTTPPQTTSTPSSKTTSADDTSSTTKTTTTTTTKTEPTTTSTTSNSVAPGVVVSAQTTTGSSGSTGSTPTPEAPEPTSVPTEPAQTTAPEPTATVEPTTPAPAPTETVEPTPTATPKPTPANDSPASSTPTANATPPVASTPSHPATPAAVDTGPAALPQNKSVKLAAVTIADVPTASSTTVSPLARVSSVTEPTPVAVVAPPNPLTMVANAVASVVNWVMGPIAGTNPSGPVQNPLGWTLLAFVRREFENFVSAVGGNRATAPTTLAAETTSLALAAAPLAAAAVAAVNVPNFPLPGTQFSPSTSFVNWVTGNYQTGNPLMADTANRFGIWGTDVGVAWDNGMVDDPTTPWNEHQILMAFGDTFSGPNMSGVWRFNTLLRTSDTNLANGIDVPNGEWFNGNMFGGAPLSNPTFARPIINPTAGLPNGVTLIPTAGISVPTPGTQFGVTQYVNFMSVSQWGAAGSWTTAYSGIAYSTDNGENFTIAPSSIRYNQPWGGNQNFQQGAFVRPGDGFVYNYGTPNGRQGAAYVSRVAEKDILDLTKYEYYSKGTAGGWFGIGATPAGWYKNNPAAATPVFGAEGGACGATAAGNTVSEMSVQYNKQLKKYVTLYGDQNNSIVMRTSDTPQGGWSAAKVLMTQQQGGIYAPMMIPSSPSTIGTGSDLYWNLSLYSEYNVMLMKTDLSKV